MLTPTRTSSQPRLQPPEMKEIFPIFSHIYAVISAGLSSRETGTLAPLLGTHER